MSEKYKHFEDETEATSISNGPTLNQIPHAKVVRGRILGIFPKPRWCQDGFKVLVAGAIIFCFVVGIALIVDISLRKHNKVIEVVTDDPQCTQILKNLFEKTNANAVDGAVAGMFCLAVTRPDQVSLSSGGFMVFHSKERSNAIDFQFSFPTKQQQQSQQSLMEVAVPGLVPGLMQAHKLYGKVKWARVIQPTISLAKHGFKIGNTTANNIALHYSSLSQKMKKIFSGTDGKPLQAGETLKMDKLADILAGISKGDLNPYYDDIMKQGLHWTKKTFESYETKNTAPLSINIGNLVLMTSSLPSNGVTALMALNILQNLPTQPPSPHALAETLKHVLGNHIDSNLTADGMAHLMNSMLSPKIAKEVSSLVQHIITSVIPHNTSTGNTDNEKPVSTAKLVIIDHDGEAVSMTTSLGHVFGSKSMTDSGIVLNDGLSLFPELQQHNRPPSYAAPVIAFRKKGKKEIERYAFASSADRKGLAALIQVLSNLFQANMDITQKTLNAARMFYDSVSGELSYEGNRPFSIRNVSSLSKFYGPAVKEVDDPIGCVSLVHRDAHKGQALKDARDL